MKAANCCVLEL